MPVDLDALKALYATMLDQIQHAKWTAANRAACKIADDIPALIAELRELREALRMCSYSATRIKKRNQGGSIGDIDDCDQIIRRVKAALPDPPEAPDA